MSEKVAGGWAWACVGGGFMAIDLVTLPGGARAPWRVRDFGVGKGKVAGMLGHVVAGARSARAGTAEWWGDVEAAGGGGLVGAGRGGCLGSSGGSRSIGSSQLRWKEVRRGPLAATVARCAPGPSVFRLASGG